MPTEGTTLLSSKGGAPSASSPSLVERVKAEAATAAALLLSVLFFMMCSCSMLIVNKLALNALPLPFVVLTLQMAFAVVALCCAPCYLRFGSLQDVLRWCRGIPWLFAGMLGSSMLALNFASMAAQQQDQVPPGDYGRPAYYPAEPVGSRFRRALAELVRRVATWEREDTAGAKNGENVFSMMRRIGQAKAGLAADYAAQLARSVGKVVFFAKHVDELVIPQLGAGSCPLGVAPRAPNEASVLCAPLARRAQG